MSFRTRYLHYDELTSQLRAWNETYPAITRLESLGKSREGRDVWLLTIGREPERSRPAVWVGAQVHASELAGSSVALAIAEAAIGLHAGEGAPPDIAAVRALSAPVAGALAETHFHVVPRVSPDGAEAVLATGRWIRSVPRDERLPREAARWISEDVDGDGRALAMRVEDPAGDFTEHEGVMVPRLIDDDGPFFRMYPEGRIEGFDGVNVPTPDVLADQWPDLNRNFPWSWSHDELGAGDFAGSEPETRAVLERAMKLPNVFAWLDLHTFGGVFIRPLGGASDAKMNPSDLAVFRQLEEWAKEIVGYPMVSGFEEFTYEPDKALRGDQSDFAYHQRGAIGYVCELWNLFEEIGLPAQKRFVERYFRVDREAIVKLARWDREKNSGRIFQPWREVEHSQLGRVEVGGFDPRVGIWNPPYDRLAEICDRQAQMMLRVAALAPRIALSARAVHGRVEVTVENQGYLPTHGLASAKALPWNEPLWAIATAEGGLSLASPSDARREIGHLEGWGRGRFGNLGALHLPRSQGTLNRKTVAFHVEGEGVLRVRVGSPRVGHYDIAVEVP